MPDALHLNEHRPRKQIHHRKIWQRVKLTYVVLKTGIGYESERQWEGFWQISAKVTTFLEWQLHLRQKLSLTQKNISHFHFKTWKWFLLSLTFNGYFSIHCKEKKAMISEKKLSNYFYWYASLPVTQHWFMRKICPKHLNQAPEFHYVDIEVWN